MNAGLSAWSGTPRRFVCRKPDDINPPVPGIPGEPSAVWLGLRRPRFAAGRFGRYAGAAISVKNSHRFYGLSVSFEAAPFIAEMSE
jgi:hypothetical protein